LAKIGLDTAPYDSERIGMHNRFFVLLITVLLVGCAASSRIVHEPSPISAQIAVANEEIKEGLGRVIISLGTFCYSWSQLDEAIDIYLDGHKIGTIGNKDEILAIDLYPKQWSFSFKLKFEYNLPFFHKDASISVREGEVVYLEGNIRAEGFWLYPKYVSFFEKFSEIKGKELLKSHKLIMLLEKKYPIVEDAVIIGKTDKNEEPEVDSDNSNGKSGDGPDVPKVADGIEAKSVPGISQGQEQSFPPTHTNTALAQSAQQIAKKAFLSTVLLVMEDSNGQPISLGSGFFVRSGEVASNLHVVEGAARGYAKIVGQKEHYEIKGISAVDSERDLVVLKISDNRGPTLTLGNSDAVQVGEIVYAVGNPQGLEGTFSQGNVSSIREVGADKILQVTAPISPGSSGGPVMDGKGQVIGVSVATFRGGQNLNFAIPSNYLKMLLGKAGPVKSLSGTKAAKSHSSILSGLGGRSSEGVVVSHFAWTDNRFMGYYTFSVRNNLRTPVREIICLVIFYAKDGLPIDTESITVDGPIGGSLAVRSPKRGRIDADQVRNLTARTEIRVLDYRLIE
jgi:S1-C subfamily serine protease